MNATGGKTTLCILLLLTFFIGACAGIKQPVRKIDYYTLEYEASKVMMSPPLPFVIRINRFNVAPFYNTTKIIFREKEFKRNAYYYHKWQATPGNFATYFLVRDIRQSALFKGVFASDAKISPSHTIKGTVDEFFEQDSSNKWEAVLSLSITLMKENEADIAKSILFQKRYRVKKSCRQKNPRALAEAMSQAMAAISENILSDIYCTLKK